MSRILRHVAWCLVVMSTVALPETWAQRRWRQPPRISYVYPAGGCRGETFEITIGGQYLAKAIEVHVSGEGVETSLTEHIRPPTAKEIANIREIFQRVRKKVRAEAKGRRRGGRLIILREFIKTAKAEGVTDKQLEAFNRYRKERADPKRQLNPQLTEAVKVKVTLAADAQPGMRELRLTTPLGLSNPLRFYVGQLPDCREWEPNDKFSVATRVPALPIVLNGQIMPGDVDRFRFTAHKGQQLVASVSARDLIPYLADSVPGWFQAVVTLYDADGREVAYADDFRFDPDPVLVYKIPRDGDYVLEIRDCIYRGREDFVYRIRLGELPFVSSVFPLGGRRGERVTVNVTGQNLPRTTLRRNLSDAETGLQPFRVEGKTCASNALPFAVNDLPEVFETEPNGEATRAGQVILPVIVNGRINQSGDWDVFRFHADKGVDIVAEVQARRLGSPLDSMLKLTDARGKVLAFNDDCEDKGAGLVTHHADSQLSVTIPETGDYLLWIGDTQSKGGRAYGYRLQVSPAQPDFELRIMPSAVNIHGGSSVPVTVYALRKDGFSEDIKLKLKDAPKDFTLSGGWIPGGQESVQVVLKVPAGPEPKLMRLQLEGYVTVNGREIRRTAVAADNMMQAFLYQHLVPAESWTVAVAPSRWNRPRWTIVGRQPVKLNAGGTSLIRLRTPRRRVLKRIRLELSNPPDGITIQNVTPTNGELSVILSVDADKAKPGLKGNLIINSFMERQVPQKDGQAPAKVRRFPAGVLPAVPFEVVDK